MNKKKKIPALRFPKFQNNGEWEEKKLEGVGQFVGGGTPDTSISDYWNGNILWYTPTEIKNYELRIKNYELRITNEKMVIKHRN